MPIGDILASITGEPSPTSTTFPPKRKADDDLRKPVQKVQKTGSQAADPSKPIVQPRKSPSANSSVTKAHVTGNSRSPPIQNSATSTFKNGQPTPPPTNDPPKPPKKGSFAEIMARGKVAQQTLGGQVGKIQHKKIEKQPTRREREDMKAQKGKNIHKTLGPNNRFSKPGQPPLSNGKIGAREHEGKVGKVAAEPEKKVKKAALATTGYAGTARPKPGSGNATSKRSSTASRHERDRFQDRGGSSKRYTYASEEEEEDEEDYASDISSDMEAAAFEVDEEEELAARLARKEDAEALAEESRLKREKQEKKRRLAAMAKKAPGPRY